MKKLAVFVEGQTEQIFFQRFITEMAGSNNVSLSLQSFSSNRIISLVGASSEPAATKYFVLIYDCQCDKKVKSTILANRESLIKSGFSQVLGLFDLYPTDLSELPKVKLGLYKYVPTAGIDIKLHLAIAEVEAWFLQDASHYVKIHPLLSNEKVVEASGFDPLVDSAEVLAAPAKVLKSIYQSVGYGYDKSRRHVQRTVDSLDFDSMCIQAAPLIPSFAALCSDVEEFLSS